MELFPDIIKQKYENFLNANNPTKELDYLDEYNDYIDNVMLFLERTYYDYVKNPDYYNSLINMLNKISSDKAMFYSTYLNNIEGLLFKYIIDLEIESLVDKILNTNNSNLVLFLIRSILHNFDIYGNKNKKMNNIQNRNIKKIKKYLESYIIKMHKTNQYSEMLNFLNIDYLKTDSSDFYYGKTILIQK